MKLSSEREKCRYLSREEESDNFSLFFFYFHCSDAVYCSTFIIAPIPGASVDLLFRDRLRNGEVSRSNEFQPRLTSRRDIRLRNIV